MNKYKLTETAYAVLCDACGSQSKLDKIESVDPNDICTQCEDW